MDDDYPLGEYIDVIPSRSAGRTRFWSASFEYLGVRWMSYRPMPHREVTA
jgi:hypothetical protein